MVSRCILDLISWRIFLKTCYLKCLKRYEVVFAVLAKCSEIHSMYKVVMICLSFL